MSKTCTCIVVRFSSPLLVSSAVLTTHDLPSMLYFHVRFGRWDLYDARILHLRLVYSFVS
jgi:hypothetical protein